MSRRSSVVIAALALASAWSVYGQDAVDRACTREALPRIAARPELTALFARTGEEIETEDGGSAPMGPLEVVVARIGTDGKPVLACVDNEKAARRFMEMPVEKLPGRAGQEQ